MPSSFEVRVFSVLGSPFVRPRSLSSGPTFRVEVPKELRKETFNLRCGLRSHQTFLIKLLYYLDFKDDLCLRIVYLDTNEQETCLAPIKRDTRLHKLYVRYAQETLVEG